MIFTGYVYTAQENPNESTPFATEKEAKQWCGENYRYGDDVWVILNRDGVVVSRGLCDYLFESDEE